MFLFVVVVCCCTDIHGCSRALQYALKHPFVVPEYHVKTSHRLTTTSPRAKLQKVPLK